MHLEDACQALAFVPRTALLLTSAKRGVVGYCVVQGADGRLQFAVPQVCARASAISRGCIAALCGQHTQGHAVWNAPESLLLCSKYTDTVIHLSMFGMYFVH